MGRLRFGVNGGIEGYTGIWGILRDWGDWEILR